MPVISPDAFAPPPANDMAVPVAAALREKVRRLERAYSAQRAGQEAGHLAVVPPPVGPVRCAALCGGALRLVRSGAPADGHGAARRGSVLGHGRRPALPRHGRRAGRDARGRSHGRPPPVARRREERRAGIAAARPARTAAKRLHDALARRLGDDALDARPQRCRRTALAHRAQKKPFRRPLCHRNTNLAPGVER